MKKSVVTKIQSKQKGRIPTTNQCELRAISLKPRPLGHAAQMAQHRTKKTGARMGHDCRRIKLPEIYLAYSVIDYHIHIT